MKRLNSATIGIDQGEHVMFSDFEKNGRMWMGEGPRERKKTIIFSEVYAAPPTVQVGLSLWDVDKDTNVRADVQARNISSTGFDLVFRTWGDTRVARVRLAWMSIGALRDDDVWTL